MVREQDHIEKMLDVKRQIYFCKSWKRKRDLEKHLMRLEKDWWTYRHLNASNR